MSDPVRPQRRQPTRLRHPWDSPGKNTGVGCHFLLQCMKVKTERSRSVVSNSAIPWPAAYEAPPSVGFSKQEYWSGVPLPSPKTYSRKGQTVCVCVCVCISFTATSQEKWELRGINYVCLVSFSFQTQLSDKSLFPL